MEKINTWGAHLQQFIDEATKWNIQSVKATGEILNNPFSIFWPYIEGARVKYEDFNAELENQFLLAPDKDALKTVVKGKFMPLIDFYIAWYQDHKPEISSAGFSEHDPYLSMFNVIEQTRNLILLYFPDETKIKRKPEGPTAGQVAMFFYYLIKGKVMPKPEKSHWERLLHDHKFTYSHKNVRNLYISIGMCGKDDPMNLKNIAFVRDNLLAKYPAAKALAENDYYAKERELR